MYAIGPRSVLSFCNVGVLWPNGWMDQDATWYGGGSRPSRHCVRWGSRSPSRKEAKQPHLRGLRAQANLHSVRINRGPSSLSTVAKRLDRGRPRPMRHCVRWGPSQLPPPRKWAQQPLTFRPMSTVAKRLPISATAELLLKLLRCYFCYFSSGAEYIASELRRSQFY